jgi:hypothetical protein
MTIMTDKELAMWKAYHASECEVLAGEAEIEAECRAWVEQAVAEYETNRAREQKAEAWLAGVNNADTTAYVRALARDAGPDVLDLVVLRAERARRPKRRRTVSRI